MWIKADVHVLVSVSVCLLKRIFMWKMKKLGWAHLLFQQFGNRFLSIHGTDPSAIPLLLNNAINVTLNHLLHDINGGLIQMSGKSVSFVNDKNIKRKPDHFYS